MVRIIAPYKLRDPSGARDVGVVDVEADVLPEQLEAVGEVGEDHMGSQQRGDAPHQAASGSEVDRSLARRGAAAAGSRRRARETWRARRRCPRRPPR